MSVYTLLLENNKYYVGFTNRNVNIRFKEHLLGDGSKWTRIHKPLQMINVIPGDLQIENKVTLQMMRKYGWKNVRGGSWCQVDLKYRPNNCIPGLVEGIFEDFLGDLGSEIYNESIYYQKFMYDKIIGGFNSPESNTSSNDIDDNYIIIEKETCTRCGRSNHTLKDCYATKDINGIFLKIREN